MAKLTATPWIAWPQPLSRCKLTRQQRLHLEDLVRGAHHAPDTHLIDGTKEVLHAGQSAKLAEGQRRRGQAAQAEAGAGVQADSAGTASSSRCKGSCSTGTGCEPAAAAMETMPT